MPQPKGPARTPMCILMADDDPADIYLVRKALEAIGARAPFRSVPDGVELLAYLRGEGRYADRSVAPRPGLLMLDLNMPRLDGRQALQVIKREPVLRRLPVIVLTTSEAEQDVLQSYDLGANSVIAKPPTFEGLVDIVKRLNDYWLETVSLPG